MSESRKRRQGPSLKHRTGSKENLHRPSANSSRARNMSSGGSHGKPGYQRQGSQDHVRKIVQREGRTARNLLTWNVPIDEQGGSSRPSSKSRSGGGGGNLHPPLTPPFSRRKTSSSRESSTETRRRSGFGGLDSSRGIGSPKSGATPKKSDLRARYWAFLFENLKRAVDEIYQTCEADESVVECKEVIMMLEQCSKDFKSLIQRLDLLKAYESAEEGQRPTALAWEVRKTSPSKNLVAGSGDTRTGSPVQRSLDFSNPPTPQSNGPASIVVTTGNSWADKVKGTTPPSVSTLAQLVAAKQNSPVPPPAQSEAEDTDGWETVHRGRGKYRASPVKGNHSKSNQDLHKQEVLVSQKISHSQHDSQKLSHSQQEQQKLSHSQQELHKLSHSQLDTNPTSQKSDWDKQCSHKLDLDKLHLNKIPSQGDLCMKLTNDDHEKENKPANIMDNELLKKSEPAAVKMAWTKDELFAQVDKIRLLGDMDDDDDDVDITLTTETDGEQDSDGDEAELQQQLEQVLNEEDSLAQQLEDEQEKALESANEIEQNLKQQIEREESTEMEVDSEADPEGDDLEATVSTLDSSLPRPMDWDSMVQDYEDESEYRQTTSWGDMVEDPDTRTPGRGFQMHEKLSSPSRKRTESPSESRKRHEKKQAKAQELREKYLQEKAERLRLLTKKVQEVRAWKEELLRQQRDTILCKMQRAEEKRRLQLEQKRKKAHDEETKANEIAFINTLEAQNKKHDIFTKHQESEARLQDILEERQRKHEEKLAKEAAAEERRKLLEAERKAKLLEMQERRKEREKEFEQRQQEREKERLEQARMKEKEREERIAALNAQQQAHIEELQRKIQQKQDETSRRHNKNLDKIREKAFEMSILKHSTEDHNDAPQLVPYERKKLCTACNVLIASEVFLLSHLRGKKHQQSIRENNGDHHMSKHDIEAFNLRHIIDAPTGQPDPQVTQERERQKAQKKRCKKLRQRMTTRGSEYEAALASKQQTVESEHRAKFQKIVRDLGKYLQSQDSGPWPQNRVTALDRGLGEIARIMEKKTSADQVALRLTGGISSLCRILLLNQSNNVSPASPAIIPAKSLVLTVTVLRLACKACYDNCHFMLFSNKIMSFVDMLIHHLSVLIPENFNVILTSSTGSGSSLFQLPHDPIATSLLQLLSTILSCLAKNNPTLNASEASTERMSGSGDAFMNRGNDIISYVVSVGIVDKLTTYFNNVRGPIDSNPEVSEFLQHAMGFLSSMTKFLSNKKNIFDKKKADDPTQLVATFRATELVGIVSLMYGMLLHSGGGNRGETTPRELPQHTLSVSYSALKMLNNMAMLDLVMLQYVLGEEGTSLQFRHISSYLLWYCSSQQNEELLHEVILSVGYLTVLNQDNQVIIQSGQPPTVLQQMCVLPFQYFSDQRLTNVLFPTLISCCYLSPRNKEILEQELSGCLLANYIEEKELEVQQAKLVSPPKKSKERDADARMSLAVRFPPDQWVQARKYFKLE